MNEPFVVAEGAPPLRDTRYWGEVLDGMEVNTAIEVQAQYKALLRDAIYNRHKRSDGDKRWRSKMKDENTVMVWRVR